MSKTSVIISFAVGAAAGAVAACFICRSHYDKLVKEEIQSVKDTYKRRYDALNDKQSGDLTGDTEESDESEESEKPESERAAKIREYKERLAAYGYSSDEDEEKKKEDSVDDGPYVIPPEEFGEDETYQTETLMYYDDGVLTDDFDHIIDDVEGMVGVASLNMFGKYEDDAVHVKNDKHKCYYEILRDLRSYSEYMQTRRGK